MGNTIIIAGWGTDYACAASVATIKYPDAEIISSSKRRLPETLAELALRRDVGISKILILGVSLAADPAETIKALKKLKGKKIETRWISSYTLPADYPPEIKDLVELSIDEKVCLAENVSAFLQIPRREARPSGIIRLVTLPKKELTDADLARIRLLDACGSRYRRFQDDKSYVDAIRSLAKGVALNERQMKMIEDFRKSGSRELRGKSRAVDYLREITAKIGREGSCRVLVTGESGTGKETIASLIHGHSPRSSEQFIAFNCADLTPHLIESRLFGHEKGAFTGAEKMRKGAFEQANGGTLFLDEVADLPLSAQAGLLRVIQENRFFRLGAEVETEVDVRIIAATNKNLPEMVASGEFREDLFYRLNVVNIHVPPLHERPEDIEPIANDFMIRKGLAKLKEKQISDLKAYNWPGNVRELQNILERAVVLGVEDFGTLIAKHRKDLSVSLKPESDNLSDIIRQNVRRVLDRNEGNKSRAAKAMGISLNTLKKYLR